MKKNDVFTFTAPNGVKVIGIVIYRRKLETFVNYIRYEYVAYAQNRLFTCTQMVRVIDKENYNDCTIEFEKVLVEYCVIPEYDDKLANYFD